MDCDFSGPCDGMGVVRCACECEHCVEDPTHEATCEGCPACDANPAMCAVNGHEIWQDDDGSDGEVMYVETCERATCGYRRVVTRAMFCAEHGHAALSPSLDPRYSICPRCGPVEVAA